MSEVRVENLSLSYGASRVLDDVSFTAREGDLLTLLGPSGCGKTTTLMSIAGLTSPNAGRIVCGDDVLFDGATGRAVPAERRDFGVVFQSYAIWPNMTVEANVAFPLRLRRWSRAAVQDAVAHALDLVSMGSYATRYPHELSGGQQQRVALARALVYEPRVLLLDEPLSNLDAKLREEARSWLKDLQARIGLTTILVTHDQEEALALSEQVVVMNAGKVEQSGSPATVYHQPANGFVASFVGTSNLVTGMLERATDPEHDAVLVKFGAWLVRVPVRRRDGHRDGDTVTMVVRPESLRLLPGATAPQPHQFRAEVVSRSFLGSRTQYTVKAGELSLVVVSSEEVPVGPVVVDLPPGSCHVL